MEWRGYRRNAFPLESWEADGDLLHALSRGPAVSLVSTSRFGDFDLMLQFRLPPGGNSGILYRVNEDFEAPWQSGPEMQLLDNEGHPDGRVPQTACGALYALQAPRDTPPCPPRVFNTARVRVRGASVEHWLNGVRVVACDMASEEFRAHVAASKFRDFPQFARAAEGHIVLQHHGTEAWFRNARIS